MQNYGQNVTIHASATMILLTDSILYSKAGTVKTKFNVKLPYISIKHSPIIEEEPPFAVCMEVLVKGVMDDNMLELFTILSDAPISINPALFNEFIDDTRTKTIKDSRFVMEFD